MNRIYNIVWNRTRGAWVVAAEHASRRRKGGAATAGVTATARRVAGFSSVRTLSGCFPGLGGCWPAKPAFAAGATAIALAATVTMIAPSLALAQGLPIGGQVVAGSGSIGAPNGGAMAVNQNSHRMAIDWQQFNIGAGNTVRFNQPGADAVALNRVLGPDASQIMGQLQANGRVFLVNPNGVLFGQGAQVDVGGLVASTLNIGNADFMAGNYRFRADALSARNTSASTESGHGPLPGPAQGRPAAVVNQGRITAADGGAVALLGGQVHNQGVIQARMGTVALAAGNAVTLDFAGDGLLNVQIDQAAKNALVDNGHLIQADGGQVLMTAHASDALLQTVVNNTGIVEARTLQSREGKIVLLGDFSGGSVKVAGKLDASAPDGGDGGFIDTSGAYVQVAEGVKVTTYAPQGKTGTWLIDPTDFTVGAGSAPKTGSGIGAATLAASLQSSSVELKTIAEGAQGGDIHVNAPIRWSANDRTLTLTAHRDININADITSEGNSSGLILNYGGHDGTTAGSASADTGYYLNHGAKVTLKGADAVFKVNGDTYTVIQNLDQLQDMGTDLLSFYALGQAIDAGATGDNTWGDGQGFDPIGNDTTSFTGLFDGLGHTINDLYINRPSTSWVGLFGIADDASLRNVGLVNGSVTAQGKVGGLVGQADGDTMIENSYFTGVINGSGDAIGGLAGLLTPEGVVTNSYASGTFSGKALVGGLVGEFFGSITNSYASGSVQGTKWVGGLVGVSNGSIANSYATGSVQGTDSVGGLVGKQTLGGSVTNSYWDTETSGLTDSAGGHGLKTAELQNALPSGFDSTIWGMVSGESYPYLLHQFAPGATPQVVSGFVQDADGVGLGSGISVGGWADGKALVSAQTGGKVYTGANGYYYYLLAPDTLVADNPLLMYADGKDVDDADVKGALLAQGLYADWLDMDVTGNLFDVRTSELGSWSSVWNVLAGSEAETLVAAVPNVSVLADGAFILDYPLTKTGSINVLATDGLTIADTGGLTADDSITLESYGDIVVNADLSVNNGGSISLFGADIAINADVTATGDGGNILMSACGGCGDGDIDIDGKVSMAGDYGVIAMTAERAISIRNDVSVQGNNAQIIMFGGDVSIQSGGSLDVQGSEGEIMLAACGDPSCGAGSIEIDGAVSVSGDDGTIMMMADGAVSIREAVSVTGKRAQIGLLGQDVTVQTGGSLHVGGDKGVIALAACGESGCGAMDIDDIDIDDITPDSDLDPTFGQSMDGVISVKGDVSIDGNQGNIAMSGGYIQVDSGLSIEGDDGLIALAACTDDGCGSIAINGDVSIKGDDSAIFMMADDELGVIGDVSIEGNRGMIALLGGDLTIDEESTVSITGEEGGLIALAACGDAGCGGLFGGLDPDTAPGLGLGNGGSLFLAGNVSIASNSIASNPVGIALIGDDVDLGGDVSIVGNMGGIALAANDLAIDGDVAIFGGGGVIGAFVAEGLVSNGALSVIGDDGKISLSGSSVLINNTVTVDGDGGAIEIGACGCDDEGLLAINADVAVKGADGAIDLSSEGSLLLDANLTAAAVFMQAGGDIDDVEGSVITADQLDARSDDGTIALAQGEHRVGLMQASARNGLWFSNSGDLELGQAHVAGNGDIAIRTSGDLTLVEAFHPIGGAPLPVSGTVRVMGTGDIDLVAGRAFINTLGADVLKADYGDWRIWSSTPADNTLAGLAYDFKQYNAQYDSSTVLGQGNGVLYTLAPVLDVGLQGAIVKTYDGTDQAVVTDSNYAVQGRVEGDQLVWAAGQARYSDPNADDGKTVTVDGLSLVNAYETVGGARVYGYRVDGDTASGDVGRIDRRTITVAAHDHDKVYGNADPSLSYAVGGQGLVAGDTLNGSLARAGGENVGSYAIGLGSLGNANYAITGFSSAALNITPRAITVAADDQRKFLGQADPALTWRIIDGSVAFDDGFTGLLARDSGELPGRYAIRQGGLSAGGNYALSFVDGQLLVLTASIDDELGDLATAYRAAVFSAGNTSRGPMAFDRDAQGGSQPASLYHIENDGLRMPEGI